MKKNILIVLFSLIGISIAYSNDTFQDYFYNENEYPLENTEYAFCNHFMFLFLNILLILIYIITHRYLAI